MAPDELYEFLSPVFVVYEHVVAGTGWREQDDVSSSGAAGGKRDPMGEVLGDPDNRCPGVVVPANRIDDLVASPKTPKPRKPEILKSKINL